MLTNEVFPMACAVCYESFDLVVGRIGDYHLWDYFQVEFICPGCGAETTIKTTPADLIRMRRIMARSTRKSEEEEAGL